MRLEIFFDQIPWNSRNRRLTNAHTFFMFCLRSLAEETLSTEYDRCGGVVASSTEYLSVQSTRACHLAIQTDRETERENERKSFNHHRECLNNNKKCEKCGAYTENSEVLKLHFPHFMAKYKWKQSKDTAFEWVLCMCIRMRVEMSIRIEKIAWQSNHLLSFSHSHVEFNWMKLEFICSTFHVSVYQAFVVVNSIKSLHIHY